MRSNNPEYVSVMVETQGVRTVSSMLNHKLGGFLDNLAWEAALAEEPTCIHILPSTDAHDVASEHMPRVSVNGKRMGRPPGSKNKKRRGPGRPKGSKNK